MAKTSFPDRIIEARQEYDLSSGESFFLTYLCAGIIAEIRHIILDKDWEETPKNIDAAFELLDGPSLDELALYIVENRITKRDRSRLVSLIVQLRRRPINRRRLAQYSRVIAPDSVLRRRRLLNFEVWGADFWARHPNHPLKPKDWNHA